RIHCPPEKRGEIRHLTEVFRGSIVDVGAKSVLVQLTGPEDKIESFIELCRPYGIKQLCRTGVIAIPRDTQRNDLVAGPPPTRRVRARSAVGSSAAKPEPAVPLPPS
ncbi:MAG: acetolactate synthase small subunit, partial [Planctomycetes bacterium]|nr:acetolactate synthase small subunit [Planctomycetota bacterium]